MKFRLLDLFSGIGGFSLGLERSGYFETVQFCEIDPYCRRVLAKHWPKVPCHDDVRTLDRDRLVPRIDAICGGFPCQDISLAGKLAGVGEGTRSGLWSEIARLVSELRPRYVIVENVTNLLAGPAIKPGYWFSRVLGDLAALGYDAEWHCIPLGRFGAPHERDRVWIVAYPCESGLERHWIASGLKQEIAKFGQFDAFANAEKIERLHGMVERRLSAEPSGMPDGPTWAGQQWPETEPLLCRVDDGISDRVGRTAACGNALGPIIPELIGRRIGQMESAIAALK